VKRNWGSYKAVIPIVSGIAYVPNPSDLAGRHIPERYLAGLPPALQKQRIGELTQSRDAYRMGDFSELPTDRAARKMGLVKESAYTTVAKKRGIEWRGDADDMASRVLTYYGARVTSGEVQQLADALRQSFKKGLAAWKSGGHRPGATAQNWAVARVNSLVVGGKTAWTADKKQFAVLPDKAKEEVVAQIGDVLAALKKQNRQKDVDYLQGVLSNPINVHVQGTPPSDIQGRHARFFLSRKALDRIEEQGEVVIPNIRFVVAWEGSRRHEKGTPGVITLITSPRVVQAEADRLQKAFSTSPDGVPRDAKVSLFTAHTVLHRLGDMIMPSEPRMGFTFAPPLARVVHKDLVVTDGVDRAWRNLSFALGEAGLQVKVDKWLASVVDTKGCREGWITEFDQAMAELVPFRLLYKKGRENGVKLRSDLPFVPALDKALTDYIDECMKMLVGYQVSI
jgi:hypothetical protein